MGIERYVTHLSSNTVCDLHLAMHEMQHIIGHVWPKYIQTENGTVQQWMYRLQTPIVHHMRLCVNSPSGKLTFCVIADMGDNESRPATDEEIEASRNAFSMFSFPPETDATKWLLVPPEQAQV